MNTRITQLEEALKKIQIGGHSYDLNDRLSDIKMADIATAALSSPLLPQQGGETDDLPFTPHSIEALGSVYTREDMIAYRALGAAAVLPQVGEATEIERIQKQLLDPLVVHTNMCAGKIAKVSMRDLAHVHGDDMMTRWNAFEQWERDCAAPASLGEAKAVAPEPAFIVELVDNGYSGKPHIRKWDNPGGLTSGLHHLYAAPVAQALPVDPPEEILSIMGGYPWANQGNGNKATILHRYERLRAYLATEGAKT